MIHLNQAIAIRSCGACQEMTREFGLAELGATREGREGARHIKVVVFHP